MPDQKPIDPEEEYFLREQVEQLRKLSLERRKRLAEEERERLKELHWMHCPKCGTELQTIEVRGIEVDHCFGCGGTWLDAGEVEKITEASRKQGRVTEAVLNIFKGK